MCTVHLCYCRNFIATATQPIPWHTPLHLICIVALATQYVTYNAAAFQCFSPYSATSPSHHRTTTCSTLSALVPLKEWCCTWARIPRVQKKTKIPFHHVHYLFAFWFTNLSIASFFSRYSNNKKKRAECILFQTLSVDDLSLFLDCILEVLSSNSVLFFYLKSKTLALTPLERDKSWRTAFWYDWRDGATRTVIFAHIYKMFCWLQMRHSVSIVYISADPSPLIATIRLYFAIKVT